MGDLEQEAGGRVAGGGPTRRRTRRGRPGHWQGPTHRSRLWLAADSAGDRAMLGMPKSVKYPLEPGATTGAAQRLRKVRERERERGEGDGPEGAVAEGVKPKINSSYANSDQTD